MPNDQTAGALGDDTAASVGETITDVNPMSPDGDDDSTTTDGGVDPDTTPAEGGASAQKDSTEADSSEPSSDDTAWRPGVARPGLFNHMFWPNLDENEEEEWRNTPHSMILHPDCNFRKYWDVTSMLLIGYSCYSIPKRLAFSIEAAGMVALFDRFVDIVFMIDCGLTFRTAIKPADELITDWKQIAVQYSKGWLVLDFFSSFPFDVLLDATGGGKETMDPGTARILKLIRIFRMIKILRMVRITRLLKKFQDEMSIKNGVMISIKFGIFTMMASHFIACLWFYFGTTNPANNWALHYCIWQNGDYYNEGCADICRRQTCCQVCSQRAPLGNTTALGLTLDSGLCWRDKDGKQPMHSTKYTSCIDDCTDADVGEDTVGGCPVSMQYTASFYYALVTMTTIGYGDIVPKNNAERQFSTIAMLVGASIFAYAITNMCTVVHNLNPSDVFYRGRMDELNDYMTFLRLPSVLKKKAMEYYFFKTEKSEAHYFNQSAITSSMSRAQSREMLYLLRHKVIEKVPFFGVAGDMMPKNMTADLCARAKSFAMAPDDILCRQGEVSHNMYIISRGAVRLDRDGEEVKVLSDNSLVCSAAIFTHARVGFTVTALEFTDIVEISYAMFDGLCKFYNLPRQTFWAHAVAAGCAKFDETDWWCGHTLNSLGQTVLTDDHVDGEEPADYDKEGNVTKLNPLSLDNIGHSHFDTSEETARLQKRVDFQQEYINLLTDITAGFTGNKEEGADDE